MKCPHCGLIVTDQVPKCRGCGFSINDLDRRLRRVPARVGFVNDFAGVLSALRKTRIEAGLAQFHRSCGGDFVLVTVNSTQPVKPSEYVFWLFNRWQVGGEAHAGLLILLSKQERRIECEVGYGWEPIISDAESGAVLHEQVVPLLQEGKLDKALLTGVKRLTDILERAVRPPEGGVRYEASIPEVPQELAQHRAPVSQGFCAVRDGGGGAAGRCRQPETGA